MRYHFHIRDYRGMILDHEGSDFESFVVLKRAVGSNGKFSEDAELPKSLPNIKPPKIGAAKPKQRDFLKQKPPEIEPERKVSRAAILSFEKAPAKRKERSKKRR